VIRKRPSRGVVAHLLFTIHTTVATGPSACNKEHPRAGAKNSWSCLISLNSKHTPWNRSHRQSPYNRLGDETHDQRAKTPTQSSVGRTVHPNWKMGSSNLMGIPEDITIVSLDLVRFHVHQACLLAASSNWFNGLMPIAVNVRRSLP